MKISLTINGKQEKWDITATQTLLDALRQNGYFSVKEGCREGTCGACTIILNGELVNSCLVLAARARQSEIITSEGLGTPARPHPIQQAFVEKGTVQCGYCVPGSILAVKVLLDKNPSPDDDEIKKALDGNICRCTGYIKRIEAVRYAAELLRKQT